MRQFFDKENPLGQFLKDYKKDLDFKSKEYEEYLGEIEGKPVVVSLKRDGELDLLYYDEETIYLIGKEGRVREELPLLDEAREFLKGKSKSIFIGELYGVDEGGKELPFNDTLSIIRKLPTPADANRIRFDIFDVYLFDGKKVEDNDYWERMLLIQETFEEGKYVKPIKALKDDGTSVVKEMWKEHVIEGDHEGLILRVEGDTVKIKPKKTVDAVVIAMKPQKEEELMGSLFVALMDSNETFRTLSFIGTGFSNQEREEWYTWAINNKTNSPNDDELIWIGLDLEPRVIEINYENANVRETEAFTLTNSEQWSQVEDKLSATLRKASLIRIRDDKEVNTSDLRLSQIPELESKKSFILSSDIKRIDNLYPDDQVNYEYIALASHSEGEPLLIYFNDSIGHSTITEKFDTFDLSKYEDRITNVAELIADIKRVEDAGITSIERIRPNQEPALTRRSFKLSAETDDVVEGLWAIHNNNVYVDPQYPDVHINWFLRIGLPVIGAEFDRITRGSFAIADDKLYVMRNGGAGYGEDLLENQNRLGDKILYVMGYDKRLNDMVDYQVTALKKSFKLSSFK